jgi:hypothetical protein
MIWHAGEQLVIHGAEQLGPTGAGRVAETIGQFAFHLKMVAQPFQRSLVFIHAGIRVGRKQYENEGRPATIFARGGGEMRG